jgi:hypothetical protein
MFDFILDIGNYESRRVGRWDSECGKKMVSTAAVSDGDHPYETAFKHPEYNGGGMVIVEAYDSRSDALAGHERWVKTMTDGPLPDVLVDCCNDGISKLCSDLRFPRVPTPAIKVCEP